MIIELLDKSTLVIFVNKNSKVNKSSDSRKIEKLAKSQKHLKFV